MRTEAARFVGSGNVWLGEGPGRHRGWQLKCPCGVVKVMGSNKTHSLPPDVIVKKLKQSGWFIGTTPDKDQCPACAVKKKRAHAFLGIVSDMVQKDFPDLLLKEEPPPAPPPVPETPKAEISLGASFFKQLHGCLLLARDQPDNAQVYIEAALRGVELALENAAAKKNWRIRLATVPPKTPPPKPVLPDPDYEKWLDEQERLQKTPE